MPTKIDGILERYKRAWSEIVTAAAQANPYTFKDGGTESDALSRGFWEQAGKELCEIGKSWMSEETKRMLELDLQGIRGRGKA